MKHSQIRSAAPEAFANSGRHPHADASGNRSTNFPASDFGTPNSRRCARLAIVETPPQRRFSFAPTHTRTFALRAEPAQLSLDFGRDPIPLPVASGRADLGRRSPVRLVRPDDGRRAIALPVRAESHAAALAAIRGYKAQRAFLATLAAAGDLTLFRGALGYRRRNRLPDDLRDRIESALWSERVERDATARDALPLCPDCRIPMRVVMAGFAYCLLAREGRRIHRAAAAITAGVDADAAIARFRDAERLARTVAAVADRERPLIAAADAHPDARMQLAAVNARILFDDLRAAAERRAGIPR